ncbi:transcription accessory protein [Deferribacter desulfuricans SSM1]|uniref:Transcription accessory protein n=1 Tax=Deferribacter desulfuricans (strain DSM 14783 / JCM 11476 / NBRC 101012 / SSM1) TaxID=639282 RepID=D3PBZ6_DEFDS|nr:Tex family protein [Deferribacter desulfuricans]BAI80119.1 transcription accessory protein [Deferribacter desulfuricans SSM1]
MIETIYSEYNYAKKHIDNLIALYKEGNTVPFIARYRKEKTGGMDENVIREIIERYEYLVKLEERKSEVIKLIAEKNKLTDVLKQKILNSTTLKEVEDLYAPYKSKRKTKADIAKELGLEPLAIYIKKESDETKIVEKAKDFLSEQVKTVDEALEKALDIIIEEFGHDVTIKSRLRDYLWDNAKILSEVKKEYRDERTNYEDYYNYSEAIKSIPPHRIFAIFRGEKEGVLKVKLDADFEFCESIIKNELINIGIVQNSYVNEAIKKALKRVLFPSLELEIRKDLKEKAEEQAIKVFAENLRKLLLTPPVKGKRIMGIDPAFRTGCKYACVDETGKLLSYGVIYPVEPQNDYENSKKVVLDEISKNNIDIIAIGNGTASRETEEFVSKVIEDEKLDIVYTIVNEAGASVYSASKVANQEFPELDLTIRGAISIARRVLDPLSELVKIDPKSIGVGMYQHDVNEKRLSEKLYDVVEDVVNNVGVNLNTASVSLLKYVSGINEKIAENIVSYRDVNGKFKERKELLNVDGIGEKVFEQCAGFLKIYDGKEPLDALFIHPENYEKVYNLLNELNISLDNRHLIKLALKGKDLDELSKKCSIGLLTLQDIIDNFEKPDRDIRDDVDPLIFKQSALNIENLKEGMKVRGKVTNVTDFGAFVDIGLKNDALVHISELADKFVKHPLDVVSVGDNVLATVIKVDKDRNRVSLSLRR